MTSVIVESCTEPRDGAFRVAIHRPDGSSFIAVGNKTWITNILGERRDAFMIPGTKAEDVPEGSSLEVLLD